MQNAMPAFGTALKRNYVWRNRKRFSMNYQLLQGDNRQVLKTLPDQSVHCIVTSPPYFGLRDYGVDGQIGLEETPAAYVTELVTVFRECWRVLRDDGVLWLNLGDSFAGSNKGVMADGSIVGGSKQRTNHGTMMGAIRKSADFEGLKPKDLMMMPHRVAMALQADGWYVRMDCVWHKPNPMPESVTDRPTKAHEYIFLLTKRPRYYYDADAVKEPAVKGAAGSEFHTGKIGIHQLGRSSTKPRSKADSFKREGSKREQTIPGQGYGTHRPDREESDYDLETRNRRSVWTVPTSPYPGAHFATFPPALIEPCILAGCPEGGTVLDPFNGSGTTGAVACAHNRNYIGIDLSADYIELAHARIREAIRESGRAYVAPVCKIDDFADMPLFAYEAQLRVTQQDGICEATK